MTYDPSKRHQGDTKSFEELNFKEQALSINGQIATLRKAIRAHVRRAALQGRSTVAVHRKCTGQVERMLAVLKTGQRSP